MRGYRIVNTAIDILVTYLICLFFFIFLPFVFMAIIRINGLVAFILIIAGFLTSIYFWNRMLHKRRLPIYEAFEKTVFEMGLTESRTRNEIMGEYRNHHIRIVAWDWGDSESSSWRTEYMEFENPQTILMGVGRRLLGSSLTQDVYLEEGKNIMMNDSEFDRRFLVKSNKESEVRAILDQSIRNKIMNIKEFNLIIGFTDIRRISESNSNSQIQNSNYVPKYKKWIDPWNRLFRGLRLGSGIVFVINVAKHIDFHHYRYEKKEDANRFKTLIDTMIDIVEKIETFTPPV